MDNSDYIKHPDYMDRFTGIESDKYSEYLLSYKASFKDAAGVKYDGNHFKVPAATKGTFEITIVNEGKAMASGELLSLFLYNGSLAHEMQKDNSEGKDYVTIETDAKCKLELFEKVPGFSKLCRILIKSGKFKKGNTITLRIGDMRSGSTGSNTYWTAGESYLFLEAGTPGNMLPVHGVPFVFEVTAREDGRFIRVLGPTVAGKGEPQRIHIGIYDNCGNLMEHFNGNVVLEGKELQISGGHGILDGVIFNKTGVHRLEARFDGAEDIFKSNPISVEDEPKHYIYWGDLHAHGWGDSTMHLMHVSNKKTAPLERHLQARDIGRLDFSAPGPMAYPRVDRRKIWDEYKDACRKTHEDGKYIPFLSYEAHPVPEGDRNVFFKSIDESMPPDFRIPMSELEETYGLRNDVFLEVHIGGRIPRWGDYKPVRERMLEAVSAFGNAEWLLQEALDKGYKPAVCGSSDLHYGLMGGPRTIEESRGRFGKYLNKRDSAFGTGPVTAVKADELTRDSIWEAFEKRHTYATTDRRIYLNLDVNGAGYGETINESDKYKVSIDVRGTDDLYRIDLVSGKYIVRTFRPEKMDFRKDFILDASEVTGSFIYLKLQQKDSAFAICTPVYIERENPAWNSGDVYAYDREEAAKHKAALVRYIRTEEDITKFSQIEPIGIVDEKITRCALFHALFGEREVSIRWYYEYEIPRFRIDWGRTNTGIQNDEMIYKI